MGAARHVGRVGGLAVALGIGAAVLSGAAAAWASPATESSGPAPSHKASAQSARHSAKPHRASAPTARAAYSQSRSATTRSVSRSVVTSTVSVKLPAMPVTKGASFTVSPDVMTGFAARYVADGGDPTDSARFFFGDLAVASLDALAEPTVTPGQTRLLLGNLATSGYFGGIWLRDNLRDTSSSTTLVDAAATASPGALSPSAIGIHLFDALAAGLIGASQSSSGWVVRAAAHASVPVLLALYGYNKGYLDVVMENPPAGVPSMQDTLSCNGFLACNSIAFPLELASRYDGALDSLDSPASLRWLEMAAWTTVLQTATGAGRFVWEVIAAGGGFSPASYTALVDLSSAYLMVSKAAVLSAMVAYADGDTGVGRSSLRLQAGLWMWSGAYFAGLASGAPAGTLPQIVVS